MRRWDLSTSHCCGPRRLDLTSSLLWTPRAPAPRRCPASDACSAQFVYRQGDEDHDRARLATERDLRNVTCPAGPWGALEPRPGVRDRRRTAGACSALRRVAEREDRSR